jgi:hypothetical protein
MPITSIGRDFLNNVSIVGFTTTDDLATVSSVNYIKNQQPIINALNKGVWSWFIADTIIVNASDGNAFYEFTDDTFSTLVLLTSPTGGTVSPGLINQVAYYPATGNTIAGTSNLPSLVQVGVNSLNSGVNANGAHFWRGDGIWATVANSTAHSIYSVYVAPDGNDTTGNGSINAPYKTISKAYSTITAATPTSLFDIVLLGGNITDTNIVLKPNINIIGNGAIVSVSGNITVDPTWDDADSMATYVEFTIDCPNPINLDFDISVATHEHHIEFDTVDVTTSNAFLINGTGREVVILRSTFGVQLNNPTLDVTLSNVSFTINDCVFNNFTHTINIPAATTTSFMSSCVVSSAITLTSNDATATINLFVSATFASSVTVNNTGATLVYDVNLPVPTVAGGGVATPIANTDKIVCTHTAVNYTPSPNNNILTSHIAGIDNALGGVAIPTTFVYVANGGSNVTGNGSFDKPYQTIAFAMASITTASPTNIFNIVLLDMIYNETSQILLKEFVCISANNPAVSINNTLPIILDTTSWTNVVTPAAYYSNFTINGSLTIDFTTVVPASFIYVQLNNITVGGVFTFHGGHFNSPNGGAGMYVFSCQFFSLSIIDCANGYLSFGSIYNGTLNVGTVDATNYCNVLHFGDFLQTVNAGKTPMTANVFYTLTGSKILSISLTDAGSALFYTADDASYITPTVVAGAPVITLKSIANGLSASYTATNYTPVATPPTLTTSVQAHLHGIDNALGSRTLKWNDVTGATQTLSVNNGYIADRGAGNVAFTLPTTAVVGDIISIVGRQNGWTVAQNASQQIIFGSSATTVGVGGSIASTIATDCFEMICTATNNEFTIRNAVGNITFV